MNLLSQIKFAWHVAGFPKPFWKIRKPWTGVCKQEDLHGNWFEQNYVRPLHNFWAQLQSLRHPPRRTILAGVELDLSGSYIHSLDYDGETEKALDKIALELGAVSPLPKADSRDLG